MRTITNECVGCPPEMGCIHLACPFYRVVRYYCDYCGEEGAKYVIDGSDYCEDCAKENLQNAFDELSIEEKASALDIDIFDVWD